MQKISTKFLISPLLPSTMLSTKNFYGTQLPPENPSTYLFMQTTRTPLLLYDKFLAPLQIFPPMLNFLSLMALSLTKQSKKISSKMCILSIFLLPTTSIPASFPLSQILPPTNIPTTSTSILKLTEKILIPFFLLRPPIFLLLNGSLTKFVISLLFLSLFQPIPDPFFPLPSIKILSRPKFTPNLTTPLLSPMPLWSLRT
mmetsp:Transcript_10577/g.21127  ORF Transcript_10577/g.21127 Transcript_10577/m.21127 type:complete len:200 (-) Transcript_10577:1692-2291(-)